MNSEKKREIEAKLQKMLKAMDASEPQDIPVFTKKAAPCNVIRRRKGEKDKRIYALS